MAASFLWTSVFIFFILELALTLILVIPVPRKFRNWICREVSKLDLKHHLHIPLICVGFALGLTLLDSLSFLQLIFAEEKEDHDNTLNHGYNEYVSAASIGDYEMLRHHEKEKEYRTERNAYLAGFALTLIFVIGRITDLMQEHVELEDDLEKLRLSSRGPVESAADGSGIEMKVLPKKPKEKKND